MKMHGNIWKIYWNPLKSIETDETRWNSMKSMGIYEHVLNSSDFRDQRQRQPLNQNFSFCRVHRRTAKHMISQLDHKTGCRRGEGGWASTDLLATSLITLKNHKTYRLGCRRGEGGGVQADPLATSLVTHEGHMTYLPSCQKEGGEGGGPRGFDH